MGFSDDSAKKLISNGFDSLEVLQLLRGNNGAIEDLDLNLAQRLLLEKHLCDGKEGSSVSPAEGMTTSTNTEPCMTLNEVLNSVYSGSIVSNEGEPGQNRPEKQTTTYPTQPNRPPVGPQQRDMMPEAQAKLTPAPLTSIDDPQLYLRGESQFKVVVHDILDFIHIIPPLIEDQVMSDVNGVQVLIRNAPRKPKIQNVSVEDWCLANMRIMDRLMSEGSLGSTTAIRDYMAYTVKICEYFRGKERISVLQYDREYRHMQARFGFRWGMDVPHLVNVHLQNKDRVEIRNSLGGNNGFKIRSGNINDPCRLYNSRKGCHYGQNCKFVHTCNEPGCKEQHPRYNHGNSDVRNRPTQGTNDGAPPRT